MYNLSHVYSVKIYDDWLWVERDRVPDVKEYKIMCQTEIDENMSIKCLKCLQLCN